MAKKKESWWKTQLLKDYKEMTAGRIDDTKVQASVMRTFESGAIRDTEEGKIDYEGFLSPLVIEAFGKYMNRNRKTSVGKRDSDNWQLGIDKKVYIKSMFRHFMDVWKEHRGVKTEEGILTALMGLMFNVMGYAYEVLKKEGDKDEN